MSKKKEVIPTKKESQISSKTPETTQPIVKPKRTSLEEDQVLKPRRVLKSKK